MVKMFIAAWIGGCLLAGLCMVAVVIGGYLVYKTKREPGEGFFQYKTPPGDVGTARGQFVQDDVDDLASGEDVSDQVKPGFEDTRISAQTDKFLRQFRGESG